MFSSPGSIEDSDSHVHKRYYILKHATNTLAPTPINRRHLLKPLQPALALKSPQQHLGALLAKLIVRQAGGDQA